MFAEVMTGPGVTARSAATPPVHKSESAHHGSAQLHPLGIPSIDFQSHVS